MTPDQTDGPHPPLEAGDGGNGDRPPDPLRRVVAAFRDRRALLRARREAESHGCEEPDIAVLSLARESDARFEIMRRLRERLIGSARTTRDGLFEECLELLEQEFVLVFVDAGSVTDRARLEETFAEHGGLIVGDDGRIFPDPEAVEKAGASGTADGQDR